MLCGADKGKNEIPLVHFPSNKVFYGIDAMLMVLSQKMPIINAIGQFPPIKWLLKKLYKLVSFNRKVIVAQKCGKGQFDCSPEFNVRYRILFLAIFLVFNSAMLYPIHFVLLNRLSFYHLSFFELETAHLLFVFCNCALSFFLPFERQLEYLGQVNMLALCTILLCIPVLIPCTLVSVGEILIAFWLLLVLAFVVKEYFSVGVEHQQLQKQGAPRLRLTPLEIPMNVPELGECALVESLLQPLMQTGNIHLEQVLQS